LQNLPMGTLNVRNTPLMREGSDSSDKVLKWNAVAIHQEMMSLLVALVVQ